MLKNDTVRRKVMARVDAKISLAQKKYEEEKKRLADEAFAELEAIRAKHERAHDDMLEQCVNEVFK